MELPNVLREALEEELKGASQQALLSAAEKISLRYRSRPGGLYIQNRQEALAYALSRMPATFGAVQKALSYTLEALEGMPEEKKTFEAPVSLLDMGAGTGAAVWAASELLELSSVTCLEYAPAMRETGQSLLRHGKGVLEKARWKSIDLVSGPVEEKADLVVASYMLNEMDRASRLQVAEKAWQAAEKLLLIIEPGTPEGYGVLRDIRRALSERGAYVLAPCPHQGDCPISETDWCHFSCRVQRSRLHKMAKSGDAPYEDEKFSYLAFVKEEPLKKEGARILRHPYIGKGYVKLELCGKDGILQKTLSKRDGELYKSARKKDWGDWLEF